MKLIKATAFITLSLFSTHLLADDITHSIKQQSKSYYIDPFIQGPNMKKVGGCGMRFPEQPKEGAGMGAKYDALMASAMNCDYMNDTTRANNFRIQAANCKTPPVQKGNSNCKTPNNTAMVFIAGTCTEKPSQKVNPTACDLFYKQSFVCSRAAEGVPASGVIGDSSLGMGCGKKSK